MPGVVLSSRLSRAPVQPSQRRGPDPTFLETLDATIRASADAEGGDKAREREAIDKIYGDVVDQLDRQGLSNPAYVRRDITNLFQRSYDGDAIWQGITRARARNPQAFANLPKSQAEFIDWATADVRRETIDRADRAARGSGAARTLGMLAYGASDPVNIATIPIGVGGAETITGAILREGIFNAKIEALQTPITAMEREARGEKYGVDQALTDIALAGAAGAVFGGIGKSFEKVVDGREAAIAKIHDVLPPSLKKRWASPAEIRTADLPDIAEAVIGRDNMSADERAAADLIRREAEVDAASPFERNGAGAAAHQEGFAEALAAVMGQAPAPSRRAELLASTSAGGAVGGRVDTGFVPARDALKNRIRAVESSGNDAAASSAGAVGRYQFLASTWLRYYKRRFGDGESDAAILAKRTDGALQETLVNDLIADNAAFLRRQGEAETAGNLYLVHFAGPGNARKLFDLPPETPARDIFSAAAIRHNPFLRDMTAGDVIAWAHRKMDEPVPPRAGARAVIDGAGSEAAAVQAEIDRLAAERQTLQRQEDAIAGEAPPLPEAPPLAPEPVRGIEPTEPLPLPLDGADAPRLPASKPGRERAFDENGTPFEYGTVNVSDIKVDAQLMQFKSGGDAAGRTAALKSEVKWKPLSSDPITLWERRDGTLIVADGHQRVGLANDVRAREGRDIPIRAVILREADGITAGDARVIAAIKNINQGTGTILDAAKVIRTIGDDRIGELLNQGASESVARLARDLARLADVPFGAVANGVIREDFGSIIGRLVPEGEGVQNAMIDLIAKTKPANRTQAESIVRDGLAAGLIDGQQTDMFGTLDMAKSLFIERAKVLDGGLLRFKKLKSVFNVAAREAETLKGAGNQIDKARSAQEALTNDQWIDLIQRLSSTAGPVKDALDAAARDLAGGAKLAEAVDGFVRRIRELDPQELIMAGRDAAGDGPVRPAGGIADAEASLFDTPAANEAAAAPFRDPDGAAVQQQADNLFHDLEAPPIDRSSSAIEGDEPLFQLRETKAEARRRLTAIRQDAQNKAIDRLLAEEAGTITPERRLGAIAQIRKILMSEAAHPNPDRFKSKVENLLGDLHEASAMRRYRERDRQSGATYIRERLLRAQREGYISEDGVAFTEWFVRQNPALLDNLAISIRQSKAGEERAAGAYYPAGRLMMLFKGSVADTTVVHEVLHHTERMMPYDMRVAIRREWARRVASLAASNDERAKAFATAIIENDQAPTAATREAVTRLMRQQSDYHLVNPSEFWAVHATDLLSRRHEAGSIWGRIQIWLGEMVQHARAALGLSNDAPVLRALNHLLERGDGEINGPMLSQGRRFNQMRNETGSAEQTIFAPAGGVLRAELPLRVADDAPELTAAQLVEKLHREEAELIAIRDCL